MTLAERLESFLRADMADELPDAPNADARYQQLFAGEGGRKADDILARLRSYQERGCDIQRFGYLCIGGADGSEVEAILQQSAVNIAAMIEISDAGAAAARAKADLLSSDKQFQVFQGDATQRLDDAWLFFHSEKKQGHIDGLIISAQAVLHELPRRSAKFIYNIFVGKVLREFDKLIFFTREPVQAENWPQDAVEMTIPGVEGARLARFARLINERLRMAYDDPQPLAQNYVSMHAVLALETLHKLLRSKDDREFLSEMGEQLTQFTVSELQSTLDGHFGGSFSTATSMTTGGFEDVYRQAGVHVRRPQPDGKLLPMPQTHVQITAFRCPKATAQAKGLDSPSGQTHPDTSVSFHSGSTSKKIDYKWDVFLSHAEEDKPVVKPIAERMRNAGLRVWFDQWEIGTSRIGTKINEGLGGSKRFVLFASPYSMQSEWVSREVDAALSLEREDVEDPFIIILLKRCELKPLLKAYGSLDFRTPGSEPWQDLLEACEAPGGQNPVGRAAGSPAEGKIKPFSRDGKKLFNTLRERIVDTIAGSEKVMAFLSRQLSLAPVSGLPASSGRITDTLLEKRFEDVKEILLDGYKSLKKPDQNDANKIRKIARLTLPWLYVCSGVNSNRLFAKGDQGILLGVLAIPAGIKSMAALIMAGLDRNEVYWRGEEKFPKAENQLSLKWRPEEGMAATDVDEIHQDLYKKIEIPDDAKTAEQQRLSINIQMEFEFTEQGKRYYLLCDPAPTETEALQIHNARIQAIQARFPVLAIVELDGNLQPRDQRLFNEIRDLLRQEAV